MKPDGVQASALPNCSSRRFGIVAARFYGDVADALIAGARRALHDCGVGDEHVTIHEVPGCFELPFACRNLIDTDRYDALVALGAVIRGQTPHFEYIAGECARGIMDVQLATGVPIGFGVLTTENLTQAQERADPSGANKGYAAALAAATLLSMDVGNPRAGFRRN